MPKTKYFKLEVFEISIVVTFCISYLRVFLIVFDPRPGIDILGTPDSN